MKRALLLTCLVCLATGVAAADKITPPPGWTADADAAAKLDRRGDHFGGALSTVKLDVYKPATRGAVLYVLRVSAAVTERRDAAASAELHEIADALKRAGSVQTDEASQKADVDKKQLEAVARWRDGAAGIVTSARIVIAADAQTINAVRGDCILAADVAKDVAAACDAALATLDPEIPADKRVALAITEPAVAPAVPDTPHQRLDDSPRTPMTPIPVAPQPQPQRETDHRPVYVGGGLVVLAIAFWYNRRRRERFEREDKPGAAKAGAGDDDDEPGDDEDADDLHAAAASSPPSPRGPAASSTADDDRKDAITKESHD